MDGLDAFLDMYGLAAIFVVMLVKSVGVPIPIPSDVIMLAAAARAAEGKLVLWEAFLVLLLAEVLGGIGQFAIVRRVGRGFLYRFGRYLGLTPPRLDAASARVQRGGPLGVGLAVFTPGVRAASVAACGLAGLPLIVFIPGLIVGSVLFLGVHFALGYVGGQVLAQLTSLTGGPWLVIGLLVLLAGGFGVWMIIRRRQRPTATDGDVVAEAFEAWQEATCPICLALGAQQRLAHAHEGKD